MYNNRHMNRKRKEDGRNRNKEKCQIERSRITERKDTVALVSYLQRYKIECAITLPGAQHKRVKEEKNEEKCTY